MGAVQQYDLQTAKEDGEVNMENEDKVAKTTQKILNRLISEEVIAASIYEGAVNNVKPEQRKFIEKKFLEIAADEMQDHWKSLTKFATENGFSVPFKFGDIERHASKKMVSKLNGMKPGEDAAYYIQKGLESEVEAIRSFEEALDQEYVYELQPILLKCYYDEIQHLEDLQLLARCASLGVELK